MNGIFFDGWFGLLRTLVVGVSAYCGLVLFVRISGKRTLSKMNAFDLVVTVALGSTLATVLLSPDVALAEGLLAFGLLIGLQYAVAWLSTRFRSIQTLVKSEPALLLYRGRYVETALWQERVTHEEIRAAVRSQGLASLDDVEAVVLETDGTFSVIPRGASSPPSALEGLSIPSSPEDTRSRDEQ
jgi:uncharacterized membrane protein YcaP (DUF421 family)